MEKITIENFVGIAYIDFEFKDITILIGPQGSGKSISVKLLYFFKNFFDEIIRSIDSEETKSKLHHLYKKPYVIYRDSNLCKKI